jgi:hypothetical protein
MPESLRAIWSARLPSCGSPAQLRLASPAAARLARRVLSAATLAEFLAD